MELNHFLVIAINIISIRFDTFFYACFNVLFFFPAGAIFG